jgi:hypothetical protein
MGFHEIGYAILGAVQRSIIHKDNFVFVWRIRRSEHRLHASTKEGAIIMKRNHNGNERRLGGTLEATLTVFDTLGVRAQP